MGSVDHAAAAARVDATVRRTNYIPRTQTGDLWVAAVEAPLLETLNAEMAAGRFFDTVGGEHPAVVLGDTAARRLGVANVDHQPLVCLGGQWFAVVGMLEPVFLAPEIDNAALIGFPAAKKIFDLPATQLPPTAVYLHTQPEAIDDLRSLLGPTANPESPEAVRVSRPSDALAAREAAFTATFAAARGWSFELPLEGLLAAIVLVVVIGALAGLYPAIRAARLQPAEAVRPR